VIKSIQIDNFKSLVDFKLELAKFNCVVGLNGVGKSTLLQALDFLSQLMQGDIKGWLASRQWKASDLNSKLIKQSNIEFEVVVELEGIECSWSASFNRATLRCTKELVTHGDHRLLGVDDGKLSLGGPRQEILFDYQGSILSGLKEELLTEELKALKSQLINIRSLDLISPEQLRNRTRFAGGKLGLGGENLSALIHEQGPTIQAKLREALIRVYPQLADIQTKSLRSGWKQLEVTEQFSSKSLTSTARHMNDGMLRLMAIMLQLEIGGALLLFDEIENGINPELVEYLMDNLVNARDQVLVTTHSPMVLNFIEDEVAKSGVICLYKTDQGHTQAIRLFDLPSMASKLEFMGPGEAFIDTDLTELHKEILVMRLLGA